MKISHFYRGFGVGTQPADAVSLHTPREHIDIADLYGKTMHLK